MANVLAELFQNTANAIREKTGDTGTMKPAEFPDKIRGITTGGGVGNLVTLIATENGTYYPTEDLAIGKTYRLKTTYTQEELIAFYNLSETIAPITTISNGAMLFDTSDDHMLMIFAITMGETVYYGVVVVNDNYNNAMQIWIPQEAATVAGIGDSEGWYLTEDMTAFTPLSGIPTFTFSEIGNLYVTDISDLNGLFDLPSADGFSSVTVDVETGGYVPDTQIPPKYEDLGAAFVGYESLYFRGLCFSEDGTRIYGMANNLFYTFDATSYPFTLLSTKQLSTAQAVTCWLSPDRTLIATSHGSTSPYITVYDLATDEPTVVSDTASIPMTYSSFSATNVVFSRDNKIMCVGLNSGYAFYRRDENGYTLIHSKAYSSYTYRKVVLLCNDRLAIACGSASPAIEAFVFGEDGTVQPVTIEGLDKIESMNAVVANGDHFLVDYDYKEAYFLGEFEIDFDTLTATELFSTRSDSVGSAIINHFSDGDILQPVNVKYNYRRVRAIQGGGYRNIPFADGKCHATPRDSVISPDDKHVICLFGTDTPTAKYLRRMDE